MAINLPFQAPGGGSQTSILMIESLVGRRVAATRQKAGRSLYSTSPGWTFSEKEAGGANAPGVTCAAIATAVCGRASFERSSQVVAAIAQAASAQADAARKAGGGCRRRCIRL